MLLSELFGGPSRWIRMIDVRKNHVERFACCDLIGHDVPFLADPESL